MDEPLPDAWRDLSAIQRDMLVCLATAGPMRGNDLNAALGRDTEQRSAVHKNLDTLRERGLVTATTDDENARAKQNALTEQGTDLIREVMLVWVQVAP